MGRSLQTLPFRCFHRERPIHHSTILTKNSAHQSGAKPHAVTNPHLPKRQKLPPRAPAPSKAKQISAMQGRVLLGEVLGGRGRLGGRRDTLRKGVPSPSKVFLTPSSPSVCGGRGSRASAGTRAPRRLRPSGFRLQLPCRNPTCPKESQSNPRCLP